MHHHPQMNHNHLFFLDSGVFWGWTNLLSDHPQIQLFSQVENCRHRMGGTHPFYSLFILVEIVNHCINQSIQTSINHHLLEIHS